MAKAMFVMSSIKTLENLVLYLVDRISNMSYRESYGLYRYGTGGSYGRVQPNPQLPYTEMPDVIAAIKEQFGNIKGGEQYPSVDYTYSWHQGGLVTLVVKLTPKNEGVELSMRVCCEYWYNMFVHDCNDLIFQNLKANSGFKVQCDCADCDKLEPCCEKCQCERAKCKHTLIGISSLRDSQGVVSKLKATIVDGLGSEEKIFQPSVFERTEEQLQAIDRARSFVMRLLANSLIRQPAMTWAGDVDVEVLKITDDELSMVSLAFTRGELLDIDRQLKLLNFGIQNEAEWSQCNSPVPKVGNVECRLPWLTSNWHTDNPKRYGNDEAYQNFKCAPQYHIVQEEDGNFVINVDMFAAPVKSGNDLPAIYLYTRNLRGAYRRGESVYLNISSQIRDVRSDVRLNNKEKKQKVRELKQKLVDLSFPV